MSEQRHEWKVNGVPWEVSRIGGGKLIVTAGDLQWADHMTLPVVLEELTRLSAALAVAEGENTKLRETLANVYKVPGVISAVGDHVEKARNGGSENG